MTSFAWYATVGAVLVALGFSAMFLTADRFRRLVALNVAAGGTLVILLAVAGRADPPDPVPHALALTGIVITVAFTGLGVVLARRLDDADRADHPAGAGPSAAASGPEGDDDDAASPDGRPPT